MSDDAFYGEVDDTGKLQLENRAAFLQYVAALRGQRVELTVWSIEHPRTSRALRYYFKKVVQPLGRELGNSVAEMHEILALRFLRIENDPVTGERRRRPLPKDRRAFAQYVDHCIEFATVEHHVTIEPPSQE